jgi:hypothetical protein
LAPHIFSEMNEFYSRCADIVIVCAVAVRRAPIYAVSTPAFAVWKAGVVVNETFPFFSY